MFSYLQGVRPTGKRQQTASASTSTLASPSSSSDQYAQSPSYPGSFASPTHSLQSPLSAQTQTSSLNGTIPPPQEPMSSSHQARVSARRNSNQSQEKGLRNGRAEATLNDQVTNTKGRSQRSPNSGMHGHSSSVDVQGRQLQEQPQDLDDQSSRASPPTASRQSPGRARRPIDLAFEQMRSYTEPPFRQSIMMPLYNSQSPAVPYQYPPPAAPPPPPPPKNPKSPIKGSFRSRRPPQPQRQAPPIPSASAPQTSQFGRSKEQPPSLQPSALPQAQPAGPEAPAASQSKGKGKLNLRNPLTLLARRRSSQLLNESTVQPKKTPAVPLRDDVDPRIRGKGIHDFSAPRLGRPHTSGGPISTGKLQSIDEQFSGITVNRPESSHFATADESLGGSEKDHTPVFKEQFDDGSSEGPSIRKSEAFMKSISEQGSQPGPDPSNLPAFARNLPSSVVRQDNGISQKSSTPPPKASLEALPESPHLPPIATTSPNSSQSRTSSLNSRSISGLGSPRRFKSNASRFSFDLAGVGSAVQEKLLEDKHRQKAIRDEHFNAVNAANDSDVEDDFPNYDEMDDSGLEEKIPGINADEEDIEPAAHPVSHQSWDNGQYTTPNKSSFESAVSPGSTGLTSPDTPRDSGSNAIGFALSKISQDQMASPIDGTQASAGDNQTLRPRSTPGDKSNSNLQTTPLQRVVSSDSNLAALPRRQTYHDDELYFDDGMIEDIGDDASSQGFDESVFDDNNHSLYGLPLRDRTLKPIEDPTEILDVTEPQLPKDVRSADADADKTQVSSHPSQKSENIAAELRDALTDLNEPNRPASSHVVGLTQNNLAAYNEKDLALGVMRASEEGAFDRNKRISLSSEPEADVEQAQEHDRSSGLVFDISGFEEDEAEDDDDIVAAANAEALENDDDGVYGQEFGFYARASGEAEYANGGYFGIPPEGVNRSHSGREGFQEPSLTPITERSEFSNRNSTISLAMYGYPLSASNFPSEQQLSSMINLPEDSMTLEALMKLRRSAWGGSNASLHSSSNSQNSGSPLTALPPGGILSSNTQQQGNNAAGIGIKKAGVGVSGVSGNQVFSGSSQSLNSSNGHLAKASSSDSEASPTVDSPTITLSSQHVFTSSSAPGPSKQSFPSPPMGPPPPPPVLSSASSVSPAQPQPKVAAAFPPRPALPASATIPALHSQGTAPISMGKRRSWAASSGQGGHRRHSSGGGGRSSGSGVVVGAESVSYKEEGGKWVLEKRRTGDGGQVEILGRSVIEGGRI